MLQFARNCTGMSVLEIIAEQRLGTKNLADHPRLRAALKRIEQSVRRVNPTEDERARIASLVELCFAYEAEPEAEKKANILRSLEEISENEPLELPSETIEEWEEKLDSNDSAFEIN
jgi:hypothetical protein